MIWKGAGEDQAVYESELVDNVWTPQRPIGGIGSSMSPAIEMTSTDPTSSGLIMA